MSLDSHYESDMFTIQSTRKWIALDPYIGLSKSDSKLNYQLKLVEIKYHIGLQGQEIYDDNYIYIKRHASVVEIDGIEQVIVQNN